MNNLFITFLIMFFLCKPSSAFGGGVIVGGWNPIPDLTNPTVVSVGRFAVDEHNKEARTSLKFKKVVKGDQQVVEGMNYNLTIKAVVQGGAKKSYVAVVWDIPWEKFRKLMSFKGPVV